MSLRISFTGASGTGKTTLAEFVSVEFGIPLNPVGSRSVAKAMGFDSPYDVDKAGKRAKFQRRLVEEKVSWEAAHDSFVTDRSTLDNLLYTALHDVHSIDEAVLETVKKGLSRYTHLIYCPVQSFIHVGDDAARVKDGVYHEIYDAALSGLIETYWDYSNPKYSVFFTDLDARKDEVLRYLKGE